MDSANPDKKKAKMKPGHVDLIRNLAISLGVGVLLSLLDGGIFWIGWLAYSAVLLAGLQIVTVLWRSSGGSQKLGSDPIAFLVPSPWAGNGFFVFAASLWLR